MNARTLVDVEQLECRRLMARPVPVIAQEFIGSVDHVTQVVLTFDRALDPVTAQNPVAYKMIEKFRKADADGGFFDGEDKPDTDNNHIRTETAVYDPVTNKVTLTPHNPFDLSRHFTVLVVRGTGSAAVREANGEVLDGDGNGRPGADVILRFKVAAKRALAFKDPDGDRARLKLTGDGRFFYLLPKFARSAPSIFLRFTDPATTILTGTVKKGKNGDGIADVAQLNGTASALTTIATDPAFRIASVVPDTSVTD